MTIWTLWGFKNDRVSSDLVALFSYEPSKSELEEWEEEQEGNYDSFDLVTRTCF